MVHPFLIIVNEKLIRDATIDPAWSLVHYLREVLGLTGTKVGCQQGGCGSCTVLVSRYYKEEEAFRHYAVNSCITPLASVHGCHVMTIEHVNDKNPGICHPLQDSLVKGNGSQCGFCSPGMVMSMYSATMRVEHTDVANIKKAIEGNLCRCTGYRPIMESFLKVTQNPSEDITDIEDLSTTNSLCMMENPRKIKDTRAEKLQQTENLIKKLMNDKRNSFQHVEFIGMKVHWLRPTSLVQLSSFLKKHPEAKLVSGCTSEENHPQKVYLEKEVIIQIDWIKGQHSFEVYENHICVGGAITVSELKHHLYEILPTLPSWKKRSIKSILSILQRFGSTQIRNSATIGGCLTVANNASDFQTLANALEFSALCFNPVSQAHTEIKSAFPASFAKNVIVNVKMPFTMTNEYTWAYKLSRRRFFDGAILNIASKTQVLPPKGNEDAKIFKINLAFGGVAIKRFSLQFVYGTNPQDITSDLFVKISNEIRREIESHQNTVYSKIYIKALSINLFKKLYEFLHDALHPSVAHKVSNPDALAANTLKSAQLFPKLTNEEPSDLVWMPVSHAASFKHVTGEAMYCSDLPKYTNELTMELVLSTRSHAFIEKIDVSKALKIDGVIGFVSHLDLPSKDRNLFGIIIRDEEIFASEKVLCVGQTIGGIVATTEQQAKRAAQLVHIEYTDCYPRILTIKEAIENKALYEDFSTSLKVGNVEAAFEKCDHILAGEVKIGGQAHFYMEPQSVIAVPKCEDSEIELICATQNPSDTQHAVAHALGIEASKVVVRTKRIGGGFGGKDSRSCIVALPAAIAANKFNRPVRLVLDRKTDMTISGKRDPFLAMYQVGFNSDGRLIAVKMNIYCNAGLSLDTSGVPIERAVLNLDNAYNIPNLDIYGVPAKTNRPSNTVFRGPGTSQGSHLVENILDRISAYLNIDPVDVRRMNMYQVGDITPYGQLLESCTVRQCWDECIETSDYYERKAAVDLFNSTNLYRKKGIYVTPCHFGIGYIYLSLNQGGALVNIYKDGSVAINHGGIELGQGIHTKMVQVATRELNVPASKIRILDTATDKVPNASPTSASLSSDINGMAVANACVILKARLEPYFKLSPRLSWEEVVEKAWSDRVNLSAVGFYKAPNVTWNSSTNRGSPFSYFVGGAACSEVEVDCLTGEYQILRTDIIMDVGRSLNPTIDIGQIEGAFMQGVGLFTLEEMVTDELGNLLTTGPSTYKIPTALDIPLEFNVSILADSSNPRAIYSSKSVGEPPLILANSVYFSIKYAVREFRRQMGLDTKFSMDSPATVEKVLEACSDLYEPLVV